MDYRTFAISTGRLTPETDRYRRARLALLGFSLLPQRIEPRSFCFCGAGCFPPGLFNQEVPQRSSKRSRSGLPKKQGRLISRPCGFLGARWRARLTFDDENDLVGARSKNV